MARGGADGPFGVGPVRAVADTGDDPKADLLSGRSGWKSAIVPGSVFHARTTRLRTDPPVQRDRATAGLALRSRVCGYSSLDAGAPIGSDTEL